MLSVLKKENKNMESHCFDDKNYAQQQEKGLSHNDQH